MLDTIISLADLITKQKLYKVEIIDEVKNPTTKIGRFYQNVSNGTFKTEEQAAESLGYSGPTDKNYNNLKSDLFNRMVNSVFFIDQSSSLYSDSLTAAKNAFKNYSAIRLLIGSRKRDIAIDLAHKTIKVSKKYGFTDLNYLLASILTDHYAAIAFDKSKYNKYKKFKNYYLKAMIAENDIRELKAIFDMELSKSGTGLNEKKLHEHAENINTIRKTQKEIHTYRYNLFAYLYQINFFLETRKYTELITLADEALHFFKKQGINSMDAEFMIKIRAGLAYFMLKDYKSAENYFIMLNKISRPNTTNWYSTYNYLSSLYINTERYLDTYDILTIVFNSPNFEKAHPIIVQLFKIKEAYFHFLIELGKIDPSKSKEKPLRKFRLGRFLNETPIFSKDKRGVNISILIIQMILLVQNKKYGEIIDKLDALNMYSHRYLRSDNTFRSNCFIKMLAKLPDADYHPIRWERYVKKYRQRLEEHPFELSYHNIDLEVIPFETLYDLVIEMLEK
ncbi:hypothetical protein [Portibacter lacus]|uniref:Uncharacterized protein n=1 Tax=Portibacter lacus TaxID=1099794 RepID=A0AA37WIJ4_9BACT|nr:hypothetical protein [Portibacter lacus]GLR19755.1 hypothetical protein GCM10007940_43710 [Portibacter lacus]